MARELARMRAKYGCGAEFEEPDLGLSPSGQSESVALTNPPTERRPRGSRARSDEDDGVLDDSAGHDPEDGHSHVTEPHLSSLDSPSAALYGSPSAVSFLAFVEERVELSWIRPEPVGTVEGGSPRYMVRGLRSEVISSGERLCRACCT